MIRRDALRCSATRIEPFPSLLDRLTDHRPHVERESGDGLVPAASALREAVLRDLRWLMNTTNLESVCDLARFAHVRRSVLNFGIDTLTGRTLSGMDCSGIEDSLRRSIAAFEPRILSDTIELRCLDGNFSARHHVLAVQVCAQLRCIPHPVAVMFSAEIDLDGGRIVALTAGSR